MTDGKYESGLVDELCSAGGVKSTPDAAKLKTFLVHCQTLQPEVIAPLVFEKVSAVDTKVQLKALHTIEKLATAEGCEALADYFFDNADVISDLCSAAHNGIRSKAGKVMAALGLENPNPDPVVAREPTPQTQGGFLGVAADGGGGGGGGGGVAGSAIS